MTADVVELCRRLIQNACVNDGTPHSGHEWRSAETISDFFGRGGEVFEPAPGRRSVVYRVPGRDPGAPRLMLMGHIDVVPVNEEGWSVDPFGGEVLDGFLWGRGAVDMLNLTAAMAVVFKPYLTGERDPLPGDLLYLAVADEEAAGRFGAQPLVAERWDLVGCEYLLTEIAYPPIDVGGERRYPVSVGEKGPFWTVLRTTGTPGHGSQPYGRENALASLTEGVAGLFRTPPPVAITPIWEEFVRALGLPPDQTEALCDPDRVDAEIERLAVDDLRWASYVHACTHMTVSPNVLEGGTKANVIPDRAEAQVDIRALPGMDRADVDQHLRKALGAAGDRVELVPVADHVANWSPRPNPLWEAVVDATEDLTGSRAVVPTLMPATTDARFFRDRGTIAYGAGLFDTSIRFADFLAMFHGNDERISVASLENTVNFLERTLERFAEAVRP